MAQLETPAGALAAAMLAHDAVEPAVETAGELEIGRIDGEDERVVENGFVEPVGDDQLNAVWPPVSVGAFLPFVDPREAVSPSLGTLTDRGRDRCRLQAVQCGFEALLIAHGRAASGIGEDFVWCRRDDTSGAQPCTARLAKRA